MQALCWVVTLIGTVIGGLTLLTTISTAASAPQQAAGAAIAGACVVIPYVFSRAVQELAALRRGKPEPRSALDMSAVNDPAAMRAR